MVSISSITFIRPKALQIFENSSDTISHHQTVATDASRYQVL